MWHRIGWVWHCIEGVYTKARCRECMDRWAWHCLCKDHGKVEGGAWNCIEGVALRRGCGVLSFRSVGGVFGGMANVRRGCLEAWWVWPHCLGVC